MVKRSSLAVVAFVMSYAHAASGRYEELMSERSEPEGRMRGDGGFGVAEIMFIGGMAAVCVVVVGIILYKARQTGCAIDTGVAGGAGSGAAPGCT